MSDKTKIEWTDATWNPVTGCDKVSPGCDHCYAETFAERFRGTPGHYFERGFDIVLRPDKLDQPLRWKRPRKVFVNSMSDLFHKDIPDAYIARVFAVMALAPQHTFQVLTKRHGRMRSLLNSEAFLTKYRDALSDRSGSLWDADERSPQSAEVWPLPNVWLGVSVEDQQRADLRIPALLTTPAAIRFLSCEPLLGPVDLDHWWRADHGGNKWLPDFGPQYDDGSGEPVCQAHGISRCWQGCSFIDWVIVGGESGPGARPMHPDWARTLRDQCAEAGVAFHFKQWGSHSPDGTRMNKHAAGRELDGRTHDDFPGGGATA